MTIELRPRISAPARGDDPPPPVRRPAPPRYAPHPSARAAPGATSTPPPARARMRDAQAAREARQADARRERAATHLADADPHAQAYDAFTALRGRYQDDGGGGGGGGGSAAVAAGGSAAASGEGGVEEALLGLHQQQGIFELLLPGGRTLGVVVQPVAGGVHFMLSAGGGVLERRLRHNKMELERRLQQRMQKDVRIAVL